MPLGLGPTGMVAVTVLFVAFITETEAVPQLAT